jgi:hypothetical protein
MTPIEQKFVDLANKIEDLNKQRKELQLQLDSVMLELGLGHVIKDGGGTVYLIDSVKGTYVEYKQIGYTRSRKDGEAKGTLSKTEADRFVALKGL